ncbi:hypothetical protein [Fodinibius roseus]|nr:hypothetical protein [Fodinibius roseus]
MRYLNTTNPQKLYGLFFSILAASIVIIACTDSTTSKQRNPEPAKAIVVTSTGMNFDLPGQIPSGWTTFRYQNKTDITHFFVIEKMPEFEGDQKTVEDSKEEIVPVFQNIMDDINGKDPSFPDAGFELPEWYPNVLFVGGPGLIGPNGTAETTIRLSPGTYVIECYVKMPDGTFHSTEGMIKGLEVTEEISDIDPPDPNVEMTLSSTNGIEVDGNLTAGENIVSVIYDDQKAQEHFLGFDVHLARLEDDTDMDELGAWMNWSTPNGLTTIAPVEFLGGAQEMPMGGTAYVKVNLEPGEYAWIAEVPNPAEKGMLKTFTVE